MLFHLFILLFSPFVLKDSLYDYTVVASKNHLFICSDHTGEVFQTDNSGQVVEYCHRPNGLGGYNTESYKFIYKDTLFSIGGYGFWRSSGLLTRFNPKQCEWDFVRLNKDQPICMEGLNSFDPDKGLLYTAYTKSINQGIGLIQYSDSVYQLNLNHRTWETLGSLNPKIIDYIKDAVQIIPMDGRALIKLRSKEAVVLVDFKRNEYTFIEFNYVFNIPLNINRYTWTRTDYWLHDQLVTIHKQGNLLKLDTLTLRHCHPSDCPATGQVYMPINPKTENTLWISTTAAGLAFIVITGLFIYRRKKKKQQLAFLEWESHEIALLERLITGEKLGTNTINQLFKIEFRSLEYQKQSRSVLIKKLTEKLQLYCQTKDEVIIRERSKEDERMLQFSLNTDYILELSSLIQKLKK